MTNMDLNTEYKLLIIDDEPAICNFIQSVSEEMGLSSRAASCRQEFQAAITSNYDCIIVDLSMPEIDGIEIIRILADQACSSALILISGHSEKVLESASRLAQVRGLRVTGVLTKPITIERLEDALLAANRNFQEPVRTLPSERTRQARKVSLPDFERDLLGGRIIPHYQPKVATLTGQVAAYEALVRWDHPDLGILAPGSFLSMVLEAGMVNELTLNLLDHVLADYSRWVDAGTSRPVAINIEAFSLNDLELPSRFEQKVHDYGMNPDMLILELTENSISPQEVDTLDNLVRLRMKGFRLAIDDFGTGHSTLSQLQNLPFNQLKIDKSFVDGIGKSAEAEAIITSTIELSHKLDIEVVAEGVEAPDQALFLKELGCDQLQGYFFAKPLPCKDAENWFHLRQSMKAAL